MKDAIRNAVSFGGDTVRASGWCLKCVSMRFFYLFIKKRIRPNLFLKEVWARVGLYMFARCSVTYRLCIISFVCYLLPWGWCRVGVLLRG